MKAKSVIRYYSDCGRGFWKKQQAITHDENCKCWKNPKFKSCMSCKYKSLKKDNNGMQYEPHNLQTWDYNACEHSDYGVPVHEEFQHIRKYCNFYVNNKKK
jgi:hypothetical protein